jgi:uncharacterized glyoxalase superfamily protein PhnB
MTFSTWRRRYYICRKASTVGPRVIAALGGHGAIATCALARRYKLGRALRLRVPQGLCVQADARPADQRRRRVIALRLESGLSRSSPTLSPRITMNKAKPIPDGFHTITPHLVVKDGSKAIDFYKKAFGAEELGRHPGPDGKSIMHALLKVGDSMIMLNDECPEMGARGPLAVGGTSVTLSLYVQDADKAFDRAVKAGAKVTMPLADQFWGDRYGIVTDPFGHMWAIATHKQDLTPAELAKAAQTAMASMGKGKKS